MKVGSIIIFCLVYVILTKSACAYKKYTNNNENKFFHRMFDFRLDNEKLDK